MAPLFRAPVEGGGGGGLFIKSAFFFELLSRGLSEERSGGAVIGPILLGALGGTGDPGEFQIRGQIRVNSRGVGLTGECAATEVGASQGGGRILFLSVNVWTWITQ